METPKISVVLPVYNGEKYLRDSIESVLSQTFADFELIVCDDAATDASEKIISSYHSPRLRSFRHETNRGLFPTLNSAIEQARAPWIKLWAQDDVMKPHCLQMHWDFLSQNPNTGLCYCDVEVIDDVGAWAQNSNLFATPQFMDPDVATRVLFFYGCVPTNICNVTLKKEAWKVVGKFREDLKVSGDFEMWSRLTQKYGMTRILEPLVCLRAHEGQLSQKKESLLDFVLEDPPIYQTLLGRLKESEIPFALKYRRFVYHRVYMHFMMLSLFALDWNTAKRIYLIVKNLERPIPLLLLWLISINGRFFRLSERSINLVFDSNTKEGK